MPLKRIFIGLFILLLGAVIVAMIAASLQTRQQEKPASTQQEKQNITGQSVTFTVTEGQHKKWTIVAKEAVYFTDNSGATLKDIEGTFFDLSGKPVMVFKAPKGEYLTKNQQVVLTGGVLADTVKPKGKAVSDTDPSASNDVHLSAPKMAWSSRSDIVTAEGGVLMKNGTIGQSKAQRCRFALDLSSISLEGQVESAMSL